MAKPIVALMYDFDKTLSPKNMQDYGFMDGLDVTSEEFWAECTRPRLGRSISGPVRSR